MEYEFQPGDRVRIRHDAISKVGSQLAATDWGPNRSVLTIRHACGPASGCYVVRGPYSIGLTKIDQTIFGGFLELVEKAEPQGGKTCELFRLNRGAKFLGPRDRLMMKTDERNNEDCIRSVILEGYFTGLISYLQASHEVKPLPGYEPEPELDPWEEAKVDYGDLEPGDLFRLDRDCGPGEVCAVLKKQDPLGDYYSMRPDGEVTNFRGRSDTVYRDDVLVEHNL